MIKTGTPSLRISRRQLEPVILLLVLGGLFGYLGHTMGVTNMFNTLMKTAHELLLNTVLYLMGVTVLSGALGRLLLEFGVVGLLEKLLAPLMRPLFNLPGRASLAALMTFFSDNPAIISLARDERYSKGFTERELISLTNFGTAFGMGLVVITFMATLQDGPSGQVGGFFKPAMIGLAGAMVGGMVSTRLMQWFIRDEVSDDRSVVESDLPDDESEEGPQQPVWLRCLDSLLDGGKSGVELGLAIIPGVLIISTFVMMLTFSHPEGGYTGSAFEGVALLPELAGHVSGLFYLLFGFQSPELVAFPVTSLGAVGAAISMVPAFLKQGIVTGSDIAVFTAMGMCWSGFLSTHTAMLDTLGKRILTSKAILAHAVGGICAGIAARYLFLLITAL
ncbi:nucleoside recognition domain-containing protein [Kistimonas asteriae]|uniref:nucleoside recognition domain-containing protein n=1 Tax=Kistimonas asteriae TaxID=517724 RepID=UPI001BA68EC2|nr:nucleoside recognition domain-containing protein [Kistimonas asteriae]